MWIVVHHKIRYVMTIGSSASRASLNKPSCACARRKDETPKTGLAGLDRNNGVFNTTVFIDKRISERPMVQSQSKACESDRKDEESRGQLIEQSPKFNPE